MSDLPDTPLVQVSSNRSPRNWGKLFWTRVLNKFFNNIETGHIYITLPDGQTLHFQGTSNHDLKAEIVLLNYQPLLALFLKGELSFAECYLEGHWKCVNLENLFRFILENEQLLENGALGNLVTKTANRLRHLMNSNTRSGSRKNISFHYDLGNNFYRKWLDQTMTYSSALFEDEQDSLEVAQLNKYHSIAKMAELKTSDNVLEIGCGWGGFSEVAAREYCNTIHGVTLSTEQLAYAQDRYARNLISNKATASLTDYRDISGTYDKIVSIEMFEAVGHEHWSTYFNKIQDLLKPGGIALLQVILIEDSRFDSYRKNVDFIQKYIFPGGLLPGREALYTSVQSHGLTMEEELLFGQSYAKTCKIWQAKFQEKWSELQQLGFDRRFKKMWEYYLSYCEVGFEQGTIDVGLFKIRKPS